MAAIEEQEYPIDPQPRESDREREQPRGRDRSRRSQGGGELVWNVMTVLVWLGIACTIMAFVSVYVNPESSLNPFRVMRPTLVSVVEIPTLTASPEPSETPLSGDSQAETPAAVSTATRTPIPTATETATPGPSPTPTIHSLYPFISTDEVKLIAASTFPEHEECKLWAAGRAYDLRGAPMVGITVMLGGYVNNKNINILSLTGTAVQYGPSGYEFIVADQPVNSKQAVWVQLFDQAMIPLSARVFFDTSESCDQNLILINFRQVR